MTHHSVGRSASNEPMVMSRMQPPRCFGCLPFSMTAWAAPLALEFRTTCAGPTNRRETSLAVGGRGTAALLQSH